MFEENSFPLCLDICGGNTRRYDFAFSMSFLFSHILSRVTFFTKEILKDNAVLLSMILSILSLEQLRAFSISASRGFLVSLAAR